jgi:hypothetical protein
MLTATAEAEIRTRHEAIERELLLYRNTGNYIMQADGGRQAHADRAVLLAQVRLLGNTLQGVCEDAFSQDNCPAECDAYGHVAECGAVSAAAHARHLTARAQQAETAVRRLRAAAKELQQWGATPASACWCTPLRCSPSAPASVHSPGCDALRIALAFAVTAVPA